ncbi:MAG TPA: ribonuclease HII [Candidatus Saccharimonadales bacterium]|nr:ribonuclease HII [Candidatus Saccharimonadales bacterium]
MLTVGIDEVGRGCWAGPLVAGAVILDRPLAGLKDSKLLSKSQRAKLDKLIRLQSRAIGLGWVTPKEIDRIGLSQAVSLAMERALGEIMIEYGEIVIDGNVNFLPKYKNARTLVRADNLVACVSAASIVAKQARDNWMINVAARKFPQYGFDKHVGYGTLLHRQALASHGISEIHRKSFKPIALLLG